MEFATALKIYLEVGVLGLIAIVLVCAFCLLLKKLLAKTESNDKSLASVLQVAKEQNEAMFKQMQENNKMLLEEIVHRVTTHTPTQEENDKLTTINENIDKLLKDLLHETRASRCDVVQFHNGGRCVNKHSFLKMSMTNEQVRVGVSPFISSFRDQFRSVLAFFVKQLIDTGECYIADISGIKKIDSSMYEFMASRGIQAKFGRAIKDDNGYMIGFVCVEFENKDEVDLDKVITSIESKQTTIQTLMNMKI